MKLRDLDACFCADVRFNTGSFNEQDSIDGAQGIIFDCPLCHRHSVLCWFSNPRNALTVPDDMNPGPGRWAISGNGIDDLTLNPSVNLDCHTPEHNARYPSSCKWHGWVQNGEAK